MMVTVRDLGIAKSWNKLATLFLTNDEYLGWEVRLHCKPRSPAAWERTDAPQTPASSTLSSSPPNSSPKLFLHCSSLLREITLLSHAPPSFPSYWIDHATGFSRHLTAHTDVRRASRERCRSTRCPHGLGEPPPRPRQPSSSSISATVAASPRLCSTRRGASTPTPALKPRGPSTSSPSRASSASATPPSSIPTCLPARSRSSPQKSCSSTMRRLPRFSPAEDAIANEEVRLKYRYLDPPPHRDAEELPHPA